jgi:hypothetical protein
MGTRVLVGFTSNYAILGFNKSFLVGRTPQMAVSVLLRTGKHLLLAKWVLIRAMRKRSDNCNSS